MKIGAKRLYSQTSQEESEIDDDELESLKFATYQKYLKHSGGKSFLSCLGMGMNFVDQDPALLKIKEIFEESLSKEDCADIAGEL